MFNWLNLAILYSLLIWPACILIGYLTITAFLYIALYLGVREEKGYWLRARRKYKSTVVNLKQAARDHSLGTITEEEFNAAKSAARWWALAVERHADTLDLSYRALAVGWKWPYNAILWPLLVGVRSGWGWLRDWKSRAAERQAVERQETDGLSVRDAVKKDLEGMPAVISKLGDDSGDADADADLEKEFNL